MYVGGIAESTTALLMPFKNDLDLLTFALDFGANPNQYVDDYYKDEMLWPMAVDVYQQKR